MEKQRERLLVKMHREEHATGRRKAVLCKPRPLDTKLAQEIQNVLQ